MPPTNAPIAHRIAFAGPLTRLASQPQSPVTPYGLVIPVNEFASAAVPTGERQSKKPVMPLLLVITPFTSRSIARNTSFAFSVGGSTIASAATDGPIIITTSAPAISGRGGSSQL